MLKYPICGVGMDEKKGPVKPQRKGKTYYFCALGCERAFDKGPARNTWAGGHEMAGHTSHKLWLWSFICGLGEETATLPVL